MQKRVDQYTDDNGVVTQATAYFTVRNIHMSSVAGGSDPIKLAGRGDTDKHEPLAVFLDSKQYQGEEGGIRRCKVK